MQAPAYHPVCNEMFDVSERRVKEKASPIFYAIRKIIVKCVSGNNHSHEESKCHIVIDLEMKGT
jgi:hypothetical protein